MNVEQQLSPIQLLFLRHDFLAQNFAWSMGEGTGDLRVLHAWLYLAFNRPNLLVNFRIILSGGGSIECFNSSYSVNLEFPNLF